MDAQIQPRLILEKGSLVEQAREILLTGQEVVVGRDTEAGLVIPSPLVSRRHLRLYPVNGRYFVEDLGSTNKTYLNGQLLEEAQVLNSGDRLQLGNAIHLIFEAPPVDDHTQLDLASHTMREAVLSGLDRTLLAEDQPQLSQPPRLLVSVADAQPQTVRLVGDRIRLGRAADNDVVLPSPIVSAHHAFLEKGEQGYLLKLEPGVTNPIYYNGTPIRDECPLHDGDVLRIGSLDPGVMVTLVYQWPAEAMLRPGLGGIVFGDKDQLQIGRDPGNDVVLESPIVSRYHAVVERIGQRFRVRDLDSANGTFVNNQRIEGDTWLKPGDAIRIGPYRLVLGEDQLARYDETGGLRVEALGLNKWVRKDLNLLKDISLLFQPREFIVVVGQSGGGKSTLVDAIAGYRPATHGRVLVNGIDIYRHFDAVRNEIGFVPQRDIIHTELTVYQALDYAARLRMPADTAPEERHRRVMEVLGDLDLVHRKDVQISGLSGGQQKRVSIGVELLTKPGLFFLDEPTSGLDPGTETALMHLMRRLADQGRTIILITHATKNVMLADKVLFLARGGYLAWFGPPDEALHYFDQYRSERDRRTRPMEFDEIYAVLDDPAKGSAEDWAARFRESPAYRQYIVQPLEALGQPALAGAATAEEQPQPAAAESLPRPARRSHGGQISALRQFTILSSRNVRILARDRVSLVLMLASAPLVAMLDVLLSVVLGRNLFDYTTGNMGNALITLFQPGMVAIMVGALAMMREFIKETDVYKRERLVNLKVLPYVLSKLWVAGLLALYQAACYTVIHYLAFDMPGGPTEFLLMYVTLVLASLAGMALGLVASAVSPNANAAPLIVILLIIPQVALGGALIPVPSVASTPIAARWSFEALLGITGAASDLAADPCWALPADQRNALTLEEKQARGCICMGLNALNSASCSFPGLGAYYDPALDQPEPQPPAAVGDPPPQPVLPPEPRAPADQSDAQAMAQYAQQLEDYQRQVDSLQADYQKQLAAYQAQADVYQANIQAYQAALADWNIKRSTAVSKAESLLARFHQDFGWAFVNKDDSHLFWSRLLLAWGAQGVMIGGLFFITLFAISRKA
jgi:ABC-type multidrug transport system ATPase subunit/pSer/pThr/pTyr-binding forkhead associated (FHA) protein